ncbi:MAG: hypothetical protein MSA09_09075 [Lachnospiraceae bacterium]|nr:hypothetical protein [Lachnospiraceae bacterium]MDD7177141.1 hypothetical protein [bacterium]MDY5518511.1 hypothetical protein [Lachnospiraceae bacterium]
MNARQLANSLDDMMKDTKRGHLSWSMQIETTDDLDASLKEKLEKDGVEWLVDECFVEYACTWKGQDFCMISYEHILTHDDQTRTTCLIFLPPLGMRFFDVAELAPYAVTADAYLINKVHLLWETLINLYRSEPARCKIRVIDPLKN